MKDFLILWQISIKSSDLFSTGTKEKEKEKDWKNDWNGNESVLFLQYVVLTKKRLRSDVYDNRKYNDFKKWFSTAF